MLAALTLALALAAPAVAAPRPHRKESTAIRQAKQVAALESLTRALAGELAALEARAAKLPTAAAEPASSPPSTLPFSGPAGGALDGSFPDPGLAPESVGTAQLQPGSVTAGAIVEGAVTADKLIPGGIESRSLRPGSIDSSRVGFRSIDGEDMLAAREFPGRGEPRGEITIPRDERQKFETRLRCPSGTTMLAAGWEFSNLNAEGMRVVASHPVPEPVEGEDVEWAWVVQDDIFSAEEVFQPQLLCLPD